ncbi:hypothetical protein AAY473_008816 [Plecturocebus cupreus]
MGESYIQLSNISKEPPEDFPNRAEIGILFSSVCSWGENICRRPKQSLTLCPGWSGALAQSQLTEASTSPGSGDPPSLASQATQTTGTCHEAQLTFETTNNLFKGVNPRNGCGKYSSFPPGHLPRDQMRSEDGVTGLLCSDKKIPIPASTPQQEERKKSLIINNTNLHF